MHHISFKTRAGHVSEGADWHTFRKKVPLDCSTEARERRGAARTLTVKVLRESPPVYLVDDFVTDAECDHMVHSTVHKMKRSVVDGGVTSAMRHSQSVNMQPDFEHEDSVTAKLARRKFAFAREVAGYDVREGEG